jgi:hypothetical protein
MVAARVKRWTSTGEAAGAEMPDWIADRYSRSFSGASTVAFATSVRKVIE